MQNNTSAILPKPNSFTRRQFLRRTALAAGVASLSFPYVGRVLGANDRINVACIGVGGKGDSDSSDAASCGGNIVAICDVDEGNRASKAKQFAEKFPQLKQYHDYRKMLEEMGKDIDAVTVSTPDHNHGVASLRAMMRQVAKQKKLATQMGNQGSAEGGLRRAVEVVQAGVIGKPLEIHVWTNRPIWPQGLDRPAGEDPVPASLDWDVWLGPARKRPFKKGVYEPFVWRGWYDFGTGALGDMACHTVNMPFRACKLGYPNVVECEKASKLYPETFPKTARIRYEFPQRGDLPPLKFWWYDGSPGDRETLRPQGDTIREIIATYDKLPGSGALIIGENGKLFSPDDYGAQFFVAMKGKTEYVAGDQEPACKAVPQSIPRSPGHMQEWFRMMKEIGVPAYSNFDIAAYLTEIILLGCVALRVGVGRRMQWDGPNMRSPNLPQAAQFVKRNNRPGWQV